MYHQYSNESLASNPHMMSIRNRHHQLVELVCSQLYDNWYDCMSYKISEYYKIKNIVMPLPISPSEFGVIAKLCIDYEGYPLPTDARYPSTLLTTILRCKERKAGTSTVKDKPILEQMKAFEQIRTNKITFAKQIHSTSTLKLKREEDKINRDLEATYEFWQHPRGLVWFLGKNEIDPDELFEADISELSPELQQMIALLKELI